MEYKLFDKPQFHDSAFYDGREVSDHLHEAAHRGRLLRALHDVLYLLEFDPISEAVCDIGCGNGGLLWELKKHGVQNCWGYDLSPKAVDYAKTKYEVTAHQRDFTDGKDLGRADVVVLTEVLEHLVDPPALLKQIKNENTRWVVASSPLYETAESHYEFHLWAWDSAGFKKLFYNAGWFILLHYAAVGGACQHMIALNKDALEKPLPIAP